MLTSYTYSLHHPNYNDAVFLTAKCTIYVSGSLMHRQGGHLSAFEFAVFKWALTIVRRHYTLQHWDQTPETKLLTLWQYHYDEIYLTGEKKHAMH